MKKFLLMALVANLIIFPVLPIAEEAASALNGYSFIKNSYAKAKECISSTATALAKYEALAWGTALVCAGTNMMAFPSSVQEGTVKSFIRTLCLTPYIFLRNTHAWLFNIYGSDPRSFVSGLIPFQELYHSFSEHEIRNNSLIAKGLAITAFGGILLYLGNKFLLNKQDNKLGKLLSSMIEFGLQTDETCYELGQELETLKAQLKKYESQDAAAQQAHTQEIEELHTRIDAVLRLMAELQRNNISLREDIQQELSTLQNSKEQDEIKITILEQTLSHIDTHTTDPYDFSYFEDPKVVWAQLAAQNESISNRE